MERNEQRHHAFTLGILFVLSRGLLAPVIAHIFADATISIPLLSGRGKDIAREPLTQAERNMIYGTWGFERFKKTFAVEVASSYLKTLELQKQIQNAEANYTSIVAARERVEA